MAFLAAWQTNENAAVPLPMDRIGFLIYRAGLLVSRAYEERMRPLGFSPGEVGLMTYLASYGAAHVRAVSRSIGVSPQTVVNLTRSLENRGLVKRESSPSDQRAVLVELTPKGRAGLAQADAVAAAFDTEIADTVGPSAAAAIMQGLTSILSAPLGGRNIKHQHETSLSPFCQLSPGLDDLPE